MAGSSQGIQVPVSLQLTNLQNIMSELQNKLGNLKVGSKGFRDIETIMNRIRNEMDKLQIQTSKPFINQSQFTTAERSVDKLEDSLAQVQIVLSRIKFSDLQLSPEQLAKVKEFDTQIQNIKNSIKNVKETAKQEFLGSEGGLAWLGFSEKNAVAATQTLAQLTNAIRSAYQQQGKEVDAAREKLEQYQRAIELQDKASKFQQSIGKAKNIQDTRKIFDEQYDQIFASNGAFKGGKTSGRNILAQWLISQFELDETTVKNLVSQSASKVLASLQDGELAQLISSKLGSLSSKTAGTTSGELEANLQRKTAQLHTVELAMNGITTTNERAAASEEQHRGAIERTTQDLHEYENSLVSAARSGKNIETSSKQGQAALENLRSTLKTTEASFLQMERTTRNFNAMKMTIANFMGFTQVLNLVKRGVREALNHIKELDTVMNRISIVTDMSTSDLWGQVDQYSKMAQAYGVSIKGAYEVSQIYYQQGLQTADVLTLTNETLKLAKISGLDYAQTTDYMTTALRGFKMEMQEASTVVDVYSNLAAHTAVTQEELAVAMSKTASSMESVGSSFEESSAMIATMVAVTRESATNIGSALKSIAARYGEMKKDPMTLVDSEGEALAFNKVDAALQSVGISMKTTDGQFRDFTDVIIELSEKWNTLESTQQRYIATQFAGNRQQSRFLALVSNADLLKSNLSYAENSEDVGTLQALKSLDSVESKLEQVKVAYQEMYTTIGVEDMWKSFLDGAKNVMNTLNGLPKLFGKIPIGAIAMVGDFVTVIKNLGFSLLGGISKVWDRLLPNELPEKAKNLIQQTSDAMRQQVEANSSEHKEIGQKISNDVSEGSAQANRDLNQPAGSQKKQEQAIEPAKEISTGNIEKTEQLATAGQTFSGAIQSASESMEKIASSSERTANNLSNAANALETAASSPEKTILTTDALETRLNSVGIREQLQNEFNNLNIDINTPIEQIDTLIQGMLQKIYASSGELHDAFAAASDDAIAGYINKLLTNTDGADNAGYQFTSASVEGARKGVDAHSDSVKMGDVADDSANGYIHTLEKAVAVAAKTGEEFGKAAVQGVRSAVEDAMKSGVDLSNPENLLGLGQQVLDKAQTQTINALEQRKTAEAANFNTNKLVLGEDGLTNSQREELNSLSTSAHQTFDNFDASLREKYGLNSEEGRLKIQEVIDQLQTEVQQLQARLDAATEEEKTDITSALYEKQGALQSYQRVLNDNSSGAMFNILSRDDQKKYRAAEQAQQRTEQEVQRKAERYRRDNAEYNNAIDEKIGASRSKIGVEQSGVRTSHAYASRRLPEALNDELADREKSRQNFISADQQFQADIAASQAKQRAAAEAERQASAAARMQGIETYNNSERTFLDAITASQAERKATGNELTIDVQTNTEPAKESVNEFKEKVESEPIKVEEQVVPEKQGLMARIKDKFGKKEQPISESRLTQEQLAEQQKQAQEFNRQQEELSHQRRRANLVGLSDKDFNQRVRSTRLEALFHGQSLRKYDPTLAEAKDIRRYKTLDNQTRADDTTGTTSILRDENGNAQYSVQMGVQPDSASIENTKKEIHDNIQEGVSEPIPAPPIEGAKEEADKAKETISETMKESVSADQLMMNFDNLSSDNFKTVPLQPEVEPQRVVEATNSAIEQSEGQLSILDIPVAAQQEVEKFKNSYEYDNESDQYVPKNHNGIALSSDEYNTKLTELQHAAEGATEAIKHVGEAGEESGNKTASGMKQGKESTEEVANAANKTSSALQKTGQSGQQTGQQLSKTSKDAMKGWSTFGASLSMIAGMFDKSSRSGQVAAGAISAVGGALRVIPGILQGIKGGLASMPWMAIAMGAMAVINGFSMAIETTEERIERLTKRAEELDNIAKQTRANEKTLRTSIEQLKELEKKRYDSAEAAEEYQSAVDKLADSFPQLITGFDSTGNVMIDTTESERVLAEARKASAKSTYEAIQAELAKTKEETKAARNELKNTALSSDVNSVPETSTNQDDYSGDKYWQNARRRNRYKVIFGEESTSLLENESGLSNDYDQGDAFIQAAADKRGYEFVQNFVDADDYNAAIDKYYSERQVDENNPLTEQEKLFYESWFGYGVDTSDKNTLAAKARVANEQLVAVLKDENATIEQMEEAYNNAYEAQRAVANSGLFEDSEIDSSSTWLSGIQKKISTLRSGQNLSTSQRGQLINTWAQNSLLNNGEQWDYLNKSSASGVLVSKFIQQDLAHSEYANIEDLNNLPSSVKEQYNKYQKIMNAHLSGRDQDWLDKWNEMLNDMDHYTAEDIISEFNLDEEKDKDIIEMIRNRYTEPINNIQDNVYHKLESMFGYDENGNLTESWTNPQFFDNLESKVQTSAQQRFINNALDQYKTLVDGGYTELAESYGKQMMSVYDTYLGPDSKLSKSARKFLLDSIAKNGSTTVEGINKTIEQVKSSDLFSDTEKQAIVTELETTRDAIVSNVNLGLQVAISDFLDSWSDASKDFSKLSSGIDIQDAEGYISSSIGQKLGLTLDDFIIDGDKLILSADKRQEYIEAFFKQRREELKTYTDQLNADTVINDRLRHNQNAFGRSLDEDDATYLKLLGIDINEYASYDAQNKKWIVKNEENRKKLNAITKKNYDEAMASAKRSEKYIDMAEAQTHQIENWNQGIYDSFDTGYNFLELMQLSDKQLNEGIKNDKDSTLYNKPSIRAAVDKARSATSNFITDLITKGFDNIDFTSYEGIPQEIANAAKNLTGDKIYNFVKEYVKYLGLSLDQTNDLLLQAYRSDQNIDKFSKNSLKDLTFIDEGQFTASESALKEFAKQWDIDLADWLGTAIQYDWNLDQYRVDFKAMGIDLSQVKGFQAKLQDDITNFWKELSDLFNKGLTSSLSFTEADDLKTFAAKIGYSGPLDFTKTAKGLKLSAQSAQELYTHIKNTNTLAGEMLFDDMRESLEKSSELYKSITGTEARSAKLEEKIAWSREKQKYQAKAGNVDLFAHAEHQISGAQMREAGWKEFTDEDYATLYSSTRTGKDFNLDTNVVLNITPITNDGKVIKSPEELNDYAEKLLAGGGTAQDIMARDTEHLVMGAWDVDVSDAQKLAEGIKIAEDEAIRLHKESDALARNFDKWDQPSDARIKQYEKELKLAKEIAEQRSTEEDDSFNFMSNKIPGAQNNPLNYFENWGKAWKTLQDSFKAKGQDKGLVDYQDFYNIMTEMGNIAAKSGVPIKLGAGKFVANAQDAAKYIEEGAKCLTVASDGSIKVDLSSFGMDFVGGADEMANGVDAGIKEIARSQIKMLDGMIQLMETVVAMEKLSSADINADNKIDLSEMFDVITYKDVDENGKVYFKKITQFTKSWDRARNNLLEWLKTDNGKDFNKALEKTKITWGNEQRSMLDLLKIGPEDVATWDEAQRQRYNAIMSAFYQAAMSGDYSNEAIMESIKEVLAGTGYEGDIDIGDLHLTFHQGVALERDKDNNYVIGDYKTKDPKKAVAAATMQNEGITNIEEAAAKGAKIDGKPIDFVGKAKIGKKTINVSHTEDGTFYHSELTNKDYSSIDELIKAEFESEESQSKTDAENIEEYKIEAGYTIIPKVTDDGATVTKKQLKELLGKSAQNLQSEWGETDKEHLKFKAKYGIEWVEGTTDEDLDKLKETSGLESKVVDITANIDANSSPIVKAIEEGKATITLNLDTDNDNGQLDNLTGTISDYSDEEADITNLAINYLTAIINSYEETEDAVDTADSFLSDLTAQITSFDTSQADPIKLDELTQFIKDINTTGADAAIAAWKEKKEKETITIKVESEPIPENPYGYYKEYEDENQVILGSQYHNERPDNGFDPFANTESTINMVGKVSNLDLTEVVDTPVSLTGQIGTPEIAETPEIEDQNATITYDANTTPAEESQKALKKEIEKETITEKVEADTSKALKESERTRSIIDAMSASINISVSNSATTVINGIHSALNSLVNGGPYRVTVEAVVSGGGIPGGTKARDVTQATGNIGFAKANGTLMGELGPELVVSKGRYFVVGQSGPEMVDLADDAIVFNHLQTKSLLEKGTSSTRGKAITNEKTAVAFAKGNINGGPAMASASEVLSTLKQLRNMWESLLKASVKDVAGKAGSGGGGGGGGDKKSQAAWIAQVERWYNLMQKIAQLEKDITHEQTLRTKIQSDFNKNGKAYFDSQVRELQNLQSQLIYQEALNQSQEDWFNTRRQALNDEGNSKNNPFVKLYEFDENGQLKYKDNIAKEKALTGADGKTKFTSGFEFLSDLMTQDSTGQAKYTAEQQYNALVKAGFGAYMEYDRSSAEVNGGEEQEFDYSAAVEAFWNNVDAQKEEMQSLHDTIEEGNNKSLELQAAQNEILQEMRDNQMEVEQSVLKAIEDSRQRAIDNLSDERSALEESTSSYIQGLSDALNQERNMYNQNESSEELNKLRRQLAILQRSGGSGSEIRSLQSEISSREQDQYFEEQQSQIDAIQAASDKELERLDAQIDLMTETLEYQKNMGLLWGEVYQVMAMSPSEISRFIMDGTAEFWGESPLAMQTQFEDLLFKSEQWAALADSNAKLTTIDAHLTPVNQQATIAEAVYGQTDRNWEVFTESMKLVYGDKWATVYENYQTSFGEKIAQNSDLTETRRDLLDKLSNLETAIYSGNGGSSSPSSSSNKKSSSSSSGNRRNSSGGSSSSNSILKNVGTAVTNGIAALMKANPYSSSANNPKTSLYGKVRGNAFAKGTLMGELGPELYVAGGKIHIAGSHGAEMVNLPDDAIVFNHLQSARLLNTGHAGHGTPVVSEQKSTGYSYVPSSAIVEGFWNNMNSTMNALANGNFIVPSMTNTMATSNSDSMIIENAVVNMNVSKIANDYDARRAGEQALDEMLKIARKTSAKNSIRR